MAALKYLCLIHHLIYALQEEFASRVVQHKLLEGQETDLTVLAISYYRFLYRICTNFEYFKPALRFIDEEKATEFLSLDLERQIESLVQLSLILQELQLVSAGLMLDSENFGPAADL